jgi:hypothetical protein
LVRNFSFLTKLLPNDIAIDPLRAIGQDGIKFGIAQGHGCCANPPLVS